MNFLEKKIDDVLRLYNECHRKTPCRKEAALFLCIFHGTGLLEYTLQPLYHFWRCSCVHVNAWCIMVSAFCWLLRKILQSCHVLKALCICSFRKSSIVIGLRHRGRCRHAFFRKPGPPNLGLSLHDRHIVQSATRQFKQVIQRCTFIFCGFP